MCTNGCRKRDIMRKCRTPRSKSTRELKDIPGYHTPFRN